MKGGTILKVESLYKSYGKHEVLKGIDLEIRSGEIYGIIGSSGSGKTTLLNSLIGFLRPTKGNILFKNPHLLSYEEDNDYRSVFHNAKEVKKIFGFAAQKPSVYEKLTLAENLSLFGSLYDLSRDACETNAKILLKLMGLYEQRGMLAQSLSGGMLKRLDIACALIHDPKILILDEPTADLDPYLRKQMWYLIRKINAKGTTIILSSHYLDELEELCDRLGIIHNGRFEVQTTPADLKVKKGIGEEIHVVTKYGRYDILSEKLLSKKELKISFVDYDRPELLVRTTKPLEVVQEMIKITDKIEDNIVDLRLNNPSMNEIFYQIVEKREQMQQNFEEEDKLISKLHSDNNSQNKKSNKKSSSSQKQASKNLGKTKRRSTKKK